MKQSEFSRLLDGSSRYDASKHDVIVDCTKYYVYRVTWKFLQGEYRPVPASTPMDLVHRDFYDYLIRRINDGKGDEAKKATCQELVLRFQEVFNLPFEDNRLAHVHASMMLPDLAKTKNEAVRQFLVGLLKNPKSHDVQRLFAISALGEFFPAREFTILDEGRKQYEDQKLRDLELVDLLVKVIEKDWKLPADAEHGEVEAIRYVRREAIRSLGRAEAAAVEAYKSKALGAAVHTLMRVVVDDGLSPPASLAEKIEAAIGLCQMKVSSRTNYDPEVAIYLVAKFALEFGNEYQKDLPNFRVAGRPALPWRFHAERLRQVIDQQATHLNNEANPRKDRAQELVLGTKKLFTDIRAHNPVSTELERINNGLLTRVRPTAGIVFKGMPALPLKLN